MIVTNIPALLSRAANRLLQARTSAEVLEAKHLAEAALHYAKVTSAANETHADCLRIITRAEIRMAQEIDAGQEAGQLTGHGGDRRSKVQASDLDNYAELGIDKRRVNDWRALAEAGYEAVDEAITTMLESGTVPTKAEIIRHVRSLPNLRHQARSTSQDAVPTSRDLPDPNAIYGDMITAMVDRREQLGRSQLEIDEIAGFNQSTVAKYEVGERRPSGIALCIWAAALSVRLAVVPISMNDALNAGDIATRRPWRRS